MGPGSQEIIDKLHLYQKQMRIKRSTFRPESAFWPCPKHLCDGQKARADRIYRTEFGVSIAFKRIFRTVAFSESRFL